MAMRCDPPETSGSPYGSTERTSWKFLGGRKFVAWTLGLLRPVTHRIADLWSCVATRSSGNAGNTIDQAPRQHRGGIDAGHVGAALSASRPYHTPGTRPATRPPTPPRPPPEPRTRPTRRRLRSASGRRQRYRFSRMDMPTIAAHPTEIGPAGAQIRTPPNRCSSPQRPPPPPQSRPPPPRLPRPAISIPARVTISWDRGRTPRHPTPPCPVRLARPPLRVTSILARPTIPRNRAAPRSRADRCSIACWTKRMHSGSRRLRRAASPRRPRSPPRRRRTPGPRNARRACCSSERMRPGVPSTAPMRWSRSHSDICAAIDLIALRSRSCSRFPTAASRPWPPIPSSSASWASHSCPARPRADSAVMRESSKSSRMSVARRSRSDASAARSQERSSARCASATRHAATLAARIARSSKGITSSTGPMAAKPV